MVGVPWRSQGCHTCKSRRVKCDEQKPTCLRCSKAGFDCGGYDRPLGIREFRFAPEPTKRKRVANKDRSKAVQQRSQLIGSRPHPFLGLGAFSENIHYSYAIHSFVCTSNGLVWLQMSASGKLGELPQQACRAFSTWTFGRHYDQHHMALEGSVAYGKTVASLRDSLARVANGTYIGQPLKELLLPILILLLHSNVSMARAESLSHIKGLTALLQACGAEAICCEGVLQAFSSARATLLAFSMLQQKRLFLEAKTWRTTPWAHAPESKSSQDKLLDVLVMVPGFLEETHDMTLNTSIGKRDLYERVAHQLHLLFTWRWKADKLQTATEKERSEDAFLSGQDCPRAASQVLRLDSFTTAFELALYDSILLCLMGLLQSLASPCRVHACIRDAALSSRPHDSPASMSNGNSAILLTPDNVSTVRSVAIELVRAFEQTIQQVQHCQIGSLFWLFPIDVAAKVLSRDPEWHPWIQRMLDTAKSTSSFKNSGELFRLSFSPWQKDVSFEAAEAATAKDTEPSISQHQYWRQTRQREKENSQVSQESQLFIDGLVLRQHQAMRTSPCA